MTLWGRYNIIIFISQMKLRVSKVKGQIQEEIFYPPPEPCF